MCTGAYLLAAAGLLDDRGRTNPVRAAELVLVPDVLDAVPQVLEATAEPQPLVFTVPPLIWVVPLALVVRLVKAAVLPTAPPKVVVPLVLTARSKPPFTLPPSVMLPAAAAPLEVSV